MARLAVIVLAALLLAGCVRDEPAGVAKSETDDPDAGGGGGQNRGRAYVWVHKTILMGLPMSGVAWENLTAYAMQDFVFGGPDTGDEDVTLFNKDSDADVLALAKALVYSRSPDPPAAYRSDVERAIREIMNEWSNPNHIECSDEPLSVARNLTCYVIAADYVGLGEPLASQFRAWLGTIADERLSEDSDCIRDNRSLHEIMRYRPNNWGTMAMAAMAAIAAYRSDATSLAEVRQIFGGWLGDRNAYAGFGYGDLCWQPNPTAPVGIGPLHSSISVGNCIFSTDGALPEELRRSSLCAPDSSLCVSDCDPVAPGRQCKVNACPQVTCDLAGGQIQKNEYVAGTLHGAVVCAEILGRHGYPDIYGWEDQALKRTVLWVQDRHTENPTAGWWFSNDDTFIPWLINKAYGTSFSTSHNTNVGKNMDFTDWTHQ